VRATPRFAFAALLAAVGWTALALQLWIAVSGALRADESVGRAIVEYLGYFTILTNGFCALILTARSTATGGPLDFFRRNGTTTCALTAILIVGVVYHFVLRSQWDPQGLQFITDLALHYVMPIAFLFFWVDVVPRGALAQRDILGWMRYPLGYVIYVFARGVVLEDYPYFFVDVSTLGWPVALRNAGFALVGYLVVASLLVVANRFGGPIRQLES